MNTQLPSTRSLHTAAGIMVLVGWGGLFYLIRDAFPDAGARWLFFVFLHIAITGTALPFVSFLNIRFIRDPNMLTNWIILRQSLWCGLFVTTCAWLQIPRVLNPFIAFLVAMVFVVIEIFLRFRERANFYYE